MTPKCKWHGVSRIAAGDTFTRRIRGLDFLTAEPIYRRGKCSTMVIGASIRWSAEDFRVGCPHGLGDTFTHQDRLASKIGV